MSLLTSSLKRAAAVPSLSPRIICASISPMFSSLISSAQPTQSPSSLSTVLALNSSRLYGIVQTRNISINRIRKYRKIENRANRKVVCKDDPEDEVPIEVYANKIDTTLTPEQKEYVESLKRKMNGSRSTRSLYREVAQPGELETNEDMEKVDANSFLPLSPNKPNELIDWALSHVPKRDGKRGTRQQNRMEQRQIIKRENDQIRIKNVKAARERQLARNAAQVAKADKFVAEGVEYRKKLDEKRAALHKKLGVDVIVKERVNALMNAK